MSFPSHAAATDGNLDGVERDRSDRAKQKNKYIDPRINLNKHINKIVRERESNA